MSVPLNHGTKEGKHRAVSLDLARGVTLLLIALAHAPLYLYTSEPGIMHRVKGMSFFDQVVNLFGMFFVDNRARAMFALLLGYGLVLSFESQISKGKSEKDALSTIRRRSWYLMFFGAVLAVFIGGQDILMAYGLAGLLVIRLLTREIQALRRTLTIITLLFCLVTPIIWGFNIQGIGSYGFAPDVSATDTYLSSMMSNLLYFPLVPLLIHLMFPILPPVLAGMWMARCLLLTKPEQQLKTLHFITLLGLTVSSLGALPLSFLGSVWHPDFFIAGLIAGFHMITGFAGGLAYAAIFGIIGAKLNKPERISRSLMALGKRSLTFYVWDETLLVLLLSPVALGLGGHVSNGAAAMIAIGVWTVSVVLATILEKNNRNGPLETLLRRLIGLSFKRGTFKNSG